MSFARPRMTEEKQTPGPWCSCSASENKCQCRMIWSKPADCVVGVALMAQDEDYTGGSGITDPEVATANQWLMAAAPELLEACRAALDCLDGESADCPEVYDQIRAAIAKAVEGK